MTLKLRGLCVIRLIQPNNFHPCLYRLRLGIKPMLSNAGVDRSNSLNSEAPWRSPPRIVNFLTQRRFGDVAEKCKCLGPVDSIAIYTFSRTGSSSFAKRLVYFELFKGILGEGKETDGAVIVEDGKDKDASKQTTAKGHEGRRARVMKNLNYTKATGSIIQNF